MLNGTDARKYRIAPNFEAHNFHGSCNLKHFTEAIFADQGNPVSHVFYIRHFAAPNFRDSRPIREKTRKLPTSKIWRYAVVTTNRKSYPSIVLFYSYYFNIGTIQGFKSLSLARMVLCCTGNSQCCSSSALFYGNTLPFRH